MEEDIGALKKEYADLREVWEAEKVSVQGAQDMKSDLEKAHVEMDQARRAGDLSRMSELQYGLIPELESQISQIAEAELARDHKTQLLRNNINSEELAEIDARWTGIPVRNQMEGDEEK